MNNLFKNLAIWLVIGVVLMTVFNQFNNRQAAQNSVEYSQFMEDAKQGKVAKAVVDGRTVRATTQDGRQITVYTPGFQDIWMVGDLMRYGVKVTAAKPEEEQSFLMNIFVSWFPMILLIGVWVFFMRQMQGGGRGGAFSFGKSKAKMLDETANTVTFADVAGCDEAKEEVGELVEFLRDPSKFQKLGGHIPKGVLMVGSPGTGKTLLAKAIAGEAKVPFFSISGSDFVEMFVGVGAARVRDMFEQAKKQAPCIIFIDEIDAVGRQRGAGLGGGNDEREQTLNQLLVELDGFEQRAIPVHRVRHLVDRGALDHQEKPVAAAFLQFGDRSARGIGQQCQVGLLGRIVHRLVDADDLALRGIDPIDRTHEIVLFLQFPDQVDPVLAACKFTDAAAAKQVDTPVHEAAGQLVGIVALDRMPVEGRRRGIGNVTQRHDAHGQRDQR